MTAAKILIIRFSSIGDIVLTTPVIRCLKQQFEGGVEIHYLTKKAFRPVLEANPYIDKIYTIQSSVGEVISELKDEFYDYVVDLHRNVRSSQVKRKLPGYAFTFNKLNREKWLLTNFKIDRMPPIHIVDRYLETVKSFGIENDGQGLDYFIPSEEEVDVASLPESHQGAYLAFVIGGSFGTKILPEPKIISLCKGIDLPIVLLGGPEDAARGERIAQAIGFKVFNACGKFRLNQSASLVRQASRVISHDTGLMHVAAAFRKPIVSVWGNTVPSFGMYPYLPKGKESSFVAEVSGLSCRPCSKLGHGKCPKKHFKCMEDQNEEEILKAVNR